MTTWAFPGLDPGMVLGVRYPADGAEVGCTVFVADTLTPDQVDRVRRELG